MDLRYTKRQIETTVEVLSHSKLVQRWCEGEAVAFGLKPDSQEYKEFLINKARLYARKLIR